MGRLTGKRTIVTGAASGIGRASARLFAREGASVFLVDRSAEAVEAVAAEIRATGATAVAMAADVGREADVKAYVARTVSEFGGKLCNKPRKCARSLRFGNKEVQRGCGFWNKFCCAQSDRENGRFDGEGLETHFNHGEQI